MSKDRPTVLIVDDEREFVDLLSAYLRCDYEVRTAYGGAEALDLAEDDIDLISLDRRMPDLSGDAVIINLRDAGWSGPILMVSAVEQRDPDLRGWDGYLEKPVLRDEYRAVERLLESEQPR